MKNSYNIIFATDINGLFGADQKIPWNCKGDMQFFRNKTLNSIVVMGKNTFLSLKMEKGLPNRTNIVISTSYLNDNVQVSSSIDDVFELIETNYENKKVYFIGGVQIITSLLEHYEDKIENIYHSIIQQSVSVENGIFLHPKINLNFTVEKMDGFELYHYKKN